MGVAQLRGFCVGALSGAVSIAAHGMGGGDTMAGMASPGASGTVLLIAACAVVGSLAASVRAPRHEWLLLAATLSGGQAVGHLMLSMDSMHPSSPNMGLGMLAAHASAVAVSAALIQAAELAYLAAVAVWERVRPPAGAPLPSVGPAFVIVPAVRAATARLLLLASAGGTRGPPLPA